jgi:hypothetical protein
VAAHFVDRRRDALRVGERRANPARERLQANERAQERTRRPTPGRDVPALSILEMLQERIPG